MINRRAYDYVKIFNKRFPFKRTIEHLVNIRIFYRLFKDKKGKVDIFHFNNGGYPAKESGLMAIFMAKLFKVNIIIMKYNNVPRRKILYRPTEHLYDWLIPKFCTKIISDSDFTKLLIIKKRNFPANKLITIRDGLEDVSLMNEERINSIKENGILQIHIGI